MIESADFSDQFSDTPKHNFVSIFFPARYWKGRMTHVLEAYTMNGVFLLARRKVAFQKGEARHQKVSLLFHKRTAACDTIANKSALGTWVHIDTKTRKLWIGAHKRQKA